MAHLKTFKENKSPGSDEFYKLFWDKISLSLINSYDESFQKGELGNSQKETVITLLQKDGKNWLLLNNWRPIFLLNVDYKILTKTIAEKIKNVLPHIIHENQCGFVKDYKIEFAIRTIQDIVDDCNNKTLASYLLFIESEKAFDYLEWNFMIKALKTFNFGPDLIRWSQTFTKIYPVV